MWKQSLGYSTISMPNSLSSLLALCLLFLVTADGRTMRALFDNVINTTSSATPLLDSTSSTTTNSNDVEGLMTLINIFPVLNGERFPHFSRDDPCYPHKLIWIQCSNDVVRRVTALYLGAQNLYGYLPDFSSMDALETIDLHGNSLKGPIPEFLGTFPELTHLNLSHTLFTGPLPDSLANNKKIKLNLAGNWLQLPPAAATTTEFPPATPTADELVVFGRSFPRRRRLQLLFPPIPPTTPISVEYRFPPIPPTTPAEYRFPIPPTTPVESRFPSAGGGGGGGFGSFDLPNIGRIKKSKLPRILKITIPTGFFTTLLATCALCCCRKKNTAATHRSDAAAAHGHTGVAAQ